MGLVGGERVNGMGVRSEGGRVRRAGNGIGGRSAGKWMGGEE